MGLSMLFWTLLLGLLIWLLVRWTTRQNTMAGPLLPGTPPNSPSALEILRQRYARGEIDAETKTMRAHLEETGVEEEDRLQQV